MSQSMYGGGNKSSSGWHFFRTDRFKNQKSLGADRSAQCIETLEMRLLFSAYALHSLVSFQPYPNDANGYYPGENVVMDSTGNLYGVTLNGGASQDGTVFEIAHGTSIVTTLASFNGANGVEPLTLTLDSNGTIYGNTGEGGTNNSGTVFKLAKGSSNLQVVASYPTNAAPSRMVPLLVDASHSLYGVLIQPPSGASDGGIFKIAAGTTSMTILASFDGPVSGGAAGMTPIGLIQDSKGNLFGATSGGGAFRDDNTGNGTLFELPKGSGSIITLASFPGGGGSEGGNGGAEPLGGIAEDSSGNLFGTTVLGGTGQSRYGYGTVYELKHGSKTITTLASFKNNNGANPEAGVVLDSTGDIFGTAAFGGHSDDGAIFELPHGSHTITDPLVFNGANGSIPLTTLLLDSSGNFYGTTTQGGLDDAGTVFEFSPPAVITGLFLVNADTGKVIEQLQNGATLNLATLPKDLTVVANTSGGIINSVLFGFDNKPRYSLLNTAGPYALFGVNNGIYIAGTFSVGHHTIYADAWAQLNAKILVARSPTISFDVVNKGG